MPPAIKAVYNDVCSRCTKVHNPNSTEQGNHVGNGQGLAGNILRQFYKGLDGKAIAQCDHPLSEPGGHRHTAEAHHLITSEAMDDNSWPIICKDYGYILDCFENGVILPSALRIACELAIPLHRGNHEATIPVGGFQNYVASVIDLIDQVKKKVIARDYCEGRADIKQDLNAKSKEIWGNVEKFAWIITYDGADYLGGQKGCATATTFGQKRGFNGSNICLRVHPDPDHQKRMKSITPSHYFKERR